MYKAITTAFGCLLLILLGSAFRAPAAAPNQPVRAEIPVPFQAGATPAATNALAGAFAKTGSATVYKMREDLSGSSFMMPGPPTMPEPVTALKATGEFRGKDYHVQLQGTLATMFGDDANIPFEAIQVGDKVYVHGPASMFDAPADKWYQLDPSGGVSMSFSPLETLSELADTNQGWTRFRQVRTGETRDGVKCDIYSGGTPVAAELYASLATDLMPPDRAPILDSGEVYLAVCADGHLHNMAATFAAHDRTNPSIKGTAMFNLDLYSFDGGVTITPPAGAVVLGSTPAAPTAPAPRASTPQPRAGTKSFGGYDGEWSGSTTADTDISFTIENNAVTFVNLSYAVHTGTCSVSGSYSTTPPVTAIVGKVANLQLTDSSGSQYAFSATFESDTRATGSLRVKGKSDNCGALDAQSTWTATREAVADAPTPEPAATIPAPTAPSAGGAGGSLRSLFDALNARDVKGAMALFGEDAMVNWGGTALMDRNEIQKWLAEQTGRGVTYQVSKVQVVGDAIVNFALAESGGGSKTYPQSNAIISDDLIEILTIK